jgi:hypothetical protein
LAMLEHDVTTMQPLIEQAVALGRQTGDTHLLGRLLDVQAVCTLHDSERRRFRLEALACYRHVGDELLAASELHSLYVLDLAAGLLSDARAHLEAAITAAEELGSAVFLYFFRSDLAILLLIDGRHAEAEPVIRQCLLFARRTGVMLDVSQAIFGAACCAAWRGDYLKAARLHGAADADMRAALASKTISWSDAEQSLQRREQSTLRDLMGDGPFNESYVMGTGMSRHQAVQLALNRDAAR